MKVLLIAPGPQDHAIAVANGLVGQAEVIFAVPDRHYRDLAGWIDPAIELHRLNWPRTRSPRNLSLLAALTRLVRQVRPDIIHVLSNTTLWLGAAVPLWRRIAPVVVTVHDVTVHPGDRDTAQLPDWGARLMVRGSDHVVVHGEALRRAAMARFARPMSEVHVLPHPAITRYADLARGMTARPAGAGLRALTFGRMFAYKGIDDLIRAEALLAGRIPGLHITLAGRGDDPGALCHLMGDPARYDIRARFIPDAEVAQLFLDCDVVVLPYAEASQSGVLPVAATFARPLIVTDVGELGATVRDHGIGLVVPPRDPAALAEALARLAADDALRAGLAERAGRFAVGPIAPARVGAATCDLYARILQRRMSPDRKDVPHIGRPN
ncbi:glycosyltransferase family 4 protein [Falsirhodobacter algicola]|uniref:Glycosyltransferase n=1 Tax=Falsirhodobacter algicola TaxID=2692330 RepID=A0A8J8MRZ3_9RHOB|nr:glycosyltransferase family 4 protein [Falsirhodobacter algicola]QUS35118.1 glycosyltransferase [Falsirhodobacter algicola]